MMSNQNTLYNPPPAYSVASANYMAPGLVYAWWLGIALVAALVSAVPQALWALADNGEYSLGYQIGSVVLVLLGLIVTAVAQGFLLNRAGLAPGPAWAAVTFGAQLLAYLLSYGLNYAIIGLSSNSSSSVSQTALLYSLGGLATGLLGALIIGVGQWLVLQRRISNAIMWVGAYVVARMVFSVIGNVSFGVVFGLLQGSNPKLDIEPRASITAATLLNSAFWSLVVTALMGLVLVYFMRNRRA